MDFPHVICLLPFVRTSQKDPPPTMFMTPTFWKRALCVILAFLLTKEENRRSFKICNSLVERFGAFVSVIYTMRRLSAHIHYADRNSADTNSGETLSGFQIVRTANNDTCRI